LVNSHSAKNAKTKDQDFDFGVPNAEEMIVVNLKICILFGVVLRCFLAVTIIIGIRSLMIYTLMTMEIY